MPRKQFIWWCFTLNFSGNLPVLKFGETVQYALWQHERGTHDHLQGVIQMKDKNTTMKKMKALLPGAHLEPMRGSPEQASAYCMKEETRVSGPWTFGEELKRGSNKRKLMDEYMEDPLEMQLIDPDKALRCKAKLLRDEFCKSFEAITLRPWQIELHQVIMREPDDRSIIWVYGEDGGEGKTWFAKELIRYGWFYTPGGRTSDILYLYAQDPERHVAMDIPRCSSDIMNYQVLEMMKNGVFASSKYRPVDLYVKKKRHVIVFANMAPDPTKLSGDRIVMIYMNE